MIPFDGYEQKLEEVIEELGRLLPKDHFVLFDLMVQNLKNPYIKDQWKCNQKAAECLIAYKGKKEYSLMAWICKEEKVYLPFVNLLKKVQNN